MLGQAVCRQLAGSFAVVPASRADLDVSDRAACIAWIGRHKPAWVVHLAALTDVDRCEREPELARAVNTDGTRWLVEACAAHGSGLLFVSSIAVFDGEKDGPYLESDSPAPINVYGATKWAAEKAVAQLSRHLIVRSGWLFGGWPDDQKFVGKISRLARTAAVLRVVDDKTGSPTYVEDLALGLRRLLLAERSGLLHLVNGGPPVARHKLAEAIVADLALPVPVEPVASTAFPRLAPRPDMEAAASHFTTGWLRPWREALREYLEAVVRRKQDLEER
jgi:dTDP-4-dehydrorhamnose reductase